MIDTALVYIKEVLTQRFSNQFESTQSKIALSNVINPDGSLPSNLDRKIVFFLTKVEQETSPKTNFNRTEDKKGKILRARPPIHLNLNLLFCANFTGESYAEGLKYLSAIIEFFQFNPTITPLIQNSPQADIKLFFEMVKLDYTELSHLWSAVGANLLPAVMYKVRLVVSTDLSLGENKPTILQSKNTTT